MAKERYKSILDGRDSFSRDVCVDGKFVGTWRFAAGENADHIVRQWVERSKGPLTSHTVSVADPLSARPMRRTNPGMELP
jgi:hypothetical protein